MIENLIWEWLVWLMSDDEVLIAGLRKIAYQQEDKLKAKRERLEIIADHIQTADRKIDRLVSELAEGGYDDNILRNAFRSQVESATAEKRKLETEFTRLSIELEQVEFTPKQEKAILSLVRVVSEKFPDANYSDKRFLLDVLNFRVEVLPDAECGKIFEVSCILPGGQAELCPVPHEG